MCVDMHLSKLTLGLVKSLQAGNFLIYFRWKFIIEVVCY